MRSRLRLATAAALAAAVAFGVPAAAHSPRDAKPGSPRMDLEVLVTPALTGRTTPGGTDAVVSVDGFGNRFALARKEPVQRAVGVDQRARAMVRTALWQWTSVDDGASWTNFDALPRGAEALLPEGTAYDVASSGTRTWLASSTPAGTVVLTVTMTGRGKVGSVTQTLLAAPRGLAPDLELAAFDGDAFLVAAGTAGTAVQRIGTSAAGASLESSLPGTGCAAAASGRAAAPRLVLACLEGGQVVQHTSLDGGATFARRVLGPADVRGGGTGAPSVDASRDGTSYVLSGTRLWRTTTAGRTTAQDVRTEGGDHRATALAVGDRGRVAVAAYRRIGVGTWQVVVAQFTSGARPVWSDFASHDPLAPQGAADPASARVSVDLDERGRLQVVWTATQVHSAELGRPLLRNVWSSRSVTS